MKPNEINKMNQLEKEWDEGVSATLQAIYHSYS